MADLKLRVTLPEDGVGGADLELDAPLKSEAPIRLLPALASAGVDALGNYFVCAGDRLIAHVKVSEPDGSTLSRRRAAQVLRAVQEYVARPGTARHDFQPKDLPSRPDSSPAPPMAA